MDFNISRLLLNREWGIRTTIKPDLKQKMMMLTWEERSKIVLNPTKNVPIYSMDFCKMPSKSMILAVSDEEGGVALIDTHTKSKHKILAYHECHNCSVYSVNWSIPRPNLLATGSSDQSVSVWDAYHFQKISTLTGHSKTVKKVKFHTTNTNLVVSGGRDSNILFWDLRSKPSPENKILTAHSMNSSDSPFIYDKKRKCNKKTSPHPTSVTDLVFIDDFTLLSCGATDGYIKFWDIRKTYKYLDKYEPVRYLEHSKVNCRGFSSMVWDGNRSLYASSALDNIFKFDLVDTELKDPISVFKRPASDYSLLLDLSPDTRYLLSGSTTPSALLYDTWDNSPTPILPFTHYEGTLDSSLITPTALFSPFDPLGVVTGADDGVVVLWGYKPDPNVGGISYKSGGVDERVEMGRYRKCREPGVEEIRNRRSLKKDVTEVQKSRSEECISEFLSHLPNYVINGQLPHLTQHGVKRRQMRTWLSDYSAPPLKIIKLKQKSTELETSKNTTKSLLSSPSQLVAKKRRKRSNSMTKTPKTPRNKSCKQENEGPNCEIGTILKYFSPVITTTGIPLKNIEENSQ